MAPVIQIVRCALVVLLSIRLCAAEGDPPIFAMRVDSLRAGVVMPLLVGDEIIDVDGVIIRDGTRMLELPVGLRRMRIWRPATGVHELEVTIPTRTGHFMGSGFATSPVFRAEVACRRSLTNAPAGLIKALAEVQVDPPACRRLVAGLADTPECLGWKRLASAMADDVEMEYAAALAGYLTLPKLEPETDIWVAGRLRSVILSEGRTDLLTHPRAGFTQDQMRRLKTSGIVPTTSRVKPPSQIPARLEGRDDEAILDSWGNDWESYKQSKSWKTTAEMGNAHAANWKLHGTSLKPDAGWFFRFEYRMPDDRPEYADWRSCTLITALPRITGAGDYFALQLYQTMNRQNRPLFRSSAPADLDEVIGLARRGLDNRDFHLVEAWFWRRTMEFHVDGKRVLLTSDREPFRDLYLQISHQSTRAEVRGLRFFSWIPLVNEGLEP